VDCDFGETIILCIYLGLGKSWKRYVGNRIKHMLFRSLWKSGRMKHLSGFVCV
jgi:hypothetical protein